MSQKDCLELAIFAIQNRTCREQKVARLYAINKGTLNERLLEETSKAKIVKTCQLLTLAQEEQLFHYLDSCEKLVFSAQIYIIQEKQKYWLIKAILIQAH